MEQASVELEQDPVEEAIADQEPGREPPAAWLGKLLRRVPVLVLGLIAVVTLAQTPPGHSVLRLAGIVKPPTGYTALYFTDPARLPATLPSGHVAMDVIFTVHNVSRSTSSYKWTVELAQGGKSLAAASGTMTVPAGAAKTEDQSMTAVCRSGLLAVTVRLATPAESIHFKAVCGG